MFVHYQTKINCVCVWCVHMRVCVREFQFDHSFRLQNTL